MSATLFDRLKTVQNPFGSLFLRQIATSDDLFGVLPLVSKEGESFSYEREVTLGNFNFIAPGGTVANSTSTSERITVTKREATEDFEIDNFVLDNQGGTSSPVVREAAQKAKAAGRAIAGKLFTGVAIDTIAVEGMAYVTDLVAASPHVNERSGPGELRWTEPGNTVAFRAPGDLGFGPEVVATGTGDLTFLSESPSKWVTLTFDAATRPTATQVRRIVFSTSTNEFEGLPQMMSADRTVDQTSTPLTFGMLDELYDMVKNRDGQVVYVMPFAHRRKLQSLLRAVGGQETPFVMSNGLQLPSFNGVPVLGNDNIPTSGNDADIYCINLTNEGSGLYLANFGGIGTIGEAADPRDAAVLGFRLRDIGQSYTTSRNKWRLSWYGTPALGSDLSIARFTTVGSD